MIQYTIGEIIKRERKAQKITQEKLAEGICTPSWLSKIETGACIPTVATFELLMQRLGKQSSQYVYFRSDIEIQIDELKFKIRRAFAGGFWVEVETYFQELKQLIPKDHQLDMEFILLYEALIKEKKEELNAEELLAMLYEAIAYSIQDFDIDLIDTYLLNQEDVVIINNIAIALMEIGETKEAINVLLSLKRYLEDGRYDYREKVRTYPVVLANLSKWQGLEGDIIGCLTSCDQGIEFCIHANVIEGLPDFLFNKSCMLIELQSLVQAEMYMKQAYHLLMIIKKENLAKIIRDYGVEKLKKDVAI